MPIRSFEQLAPRIHPTAYVDETALVVGDVEIGQDSSIWPMSVVRGDIQSIRIGARTSIQDGTIIHVT
ncbi:MAG: gamma carbonic anhydrase family protein, partial [Candidatus Competibacteraceae bacterium]|nr:gamma carbonic anhydrase family protein [Candidatus Competibacteraceae bacterium]